MNRAYPSAHTSCWEVTQLMRDDHPAERSRKASDRLLNLAAGLEPDGFLSLVIAGDGTGSVRVLLHTDTRVSDLAHLVSWVGAGVAEWRPLPPEQAHLADPVELGFVGELLPAVRAPLPQAALILEDPIAGAPAEEPRPDLWPIGFIDDGMELLQSLTSLDAQVRVHMAPASPVERQMISALTRRSVQSRDPVTYSQYMGTPVRIRCFVGQRGRFLSPRLRAALGRFGIGLQIAELDVADHDVQAAWTGDRRALSGSVQPFGVAQCFVHLPACGEEAVICGVPTAEADTPPVPIDAEVGTRGGLRLGAAVAADGSPHEVRVAPRELLLHTQILGSTGTGKSTLLAAIVAEAVAAGLGVSVIESHGPLVERIIAELPEEAVERTIVVRSGDVTNPVPLNALRTADPAMVTEVMLQVLRELLDPNNQGFLGPRFERAFGQTLEAQRVLFGPRATLSALPYLLRDRDQVKALATAVRPANPSLAAQLISELANLRPEDFAELTAWINAKFQRLVATPEVRGILGTGEDAVDVTRVVDERGVLLIDLAAPSVGPLGAQFLGEMWLAKHWAALSQRADRSQPHLLIVDEAHLFASGLLPRLLAEARKFGVGVVLAHQHLEQLTPHLRDATLATTNNVIVFRSGPREAVAALTRLGNWAGGPLTRLPRFHAAATLSLGTQQSDAFSLMLDHNARMQAAPKPSHLGDAITERSRQLFVEPYRSAVPITIEAVDARVADLVRGDRPAANASAARPGPGYLDEWLAKRRAQQADGNRAAPASPATPPAPELPDDDPWPR